MVWFTTETQRELGSRACLVPIKKYALAGQLEDYKGFYAFVRKTCHQLDGTITLSQAYDLVETKLKKLHMQGWVETAIAYKLYQRIIYIMFWMPSL